MYLSDYLSTYIKILIFSNNNKSQGCLAYAKTLSLDFIRLL